MQLFAHKNRGQGAACLAASYFSHVVCFGVPPSMCPYTLTATCWWNACCTHIQIYRCLFCMCCCWLPHVAAPVGGLRAAAMASSQLSTLWAAAR